MIVGGAFQNAAGGPAHGLAAIGAGSVGVRKAVSATSVAGSFDFGTDNEPTGGGVQRHDTGLVATRQPTASPDIFTTEAWVKTTTTTGGKIIGFGNLPVGASAFGNLPVGASALYDRRVRSTAWPTWR